MGVVVREKRKGSGEWWLFITHNGQRKSKRVGRDKVEAQKIAKILEAKLVLGEFRLDGDKTLPRFREYAQEWLENTVKSTRSISTYERYRDILAKYVLPGIGEKNLDKITRSDVRKVLLGVHQRGLSSSSVRLTRDVIGGIMVTAVDEELIGSNPVSNILKRMGLEKTVKGAIESLTPAEVKHFLDVCSEGFPEYFPFFLCAFRTGMRLGELLALQWGDVDWNQSYIQVERSFKRGKIGKTKTGKSRRVDMSEQLKLILRKLLTQRKREALKAVEGEEIAWIFHQNGSPISQNSVRNVFKRILKKAGMRQIRIHDIRHTFASLLLTNGETPVYVKEQMGHSSIQITVDIYGHLIPSSNRQAVNRLDDLHPDAPQVLPGKAKAP